MKVTIRSNEHVSSFDALQATYFGDEGDLMITIPKEGNEALEVGLKSLYGDRIKIDTESYMDRDFIFVRKDASMSVDMGEELED